MCVFVDIEWLINIDNVDIDDLNAQRHISVLYTSKGVNYTGQLLRIMIYGQVYVQRWTTLILKNWRNKYYSTQYSQRTVWKIKRRSIE